MSKTVSIHEFFNDIVKIYGKKARSRFLLVFNGSDRAIAFWLE
ncbi:MAG: hypothetical protein AB4290_09755 [Spirulina sp.]